MDTLIYFAALLIFLYGLISAVADRSPITAPMVFVAIGVLAGPLGFGLFEVNIDSQLVEIIAEVTLVVILFTDASSIKLKVLEKEYTVPLRLLAIGLPLTMIAGFALALIAYALADRIGGNGFIAAFCAGLFFAARSKTVRARIQEFGEAEGQQLSLFVFLMFGMVLVPVAHAYWDWTALVYALLSLTVIRMVPVALSLIGTKLDLTTMAFIGWFGPRGIASVLYLMILVGELGSKANRQILSVIVLTVLLSVFIHGRPTFECLRPLRGTQPETRWSG